jgi:hypothetical protein
MVDKKDSLEKYKGKQYPPLDKKMEQATPQLIKTEAEYQAVEEFKSRKSTRFRIVDADGKSYGCSYPHLIDWVCEPPTLLTISTATRIFTLQGNHLERIEQLLMEDKVKVLHVFNEKRYNLPASNKLIIEKLEINEQ